MRFVSRWIAPLVASTFLYLGGPVQAASHREAPLISQDPTADITDVYLFRSWNNPGNVVLIMNVIPSQEPGSGPNYFTFSDDVVYGFHFDVNGDGQADDINIEVRFQTEIRGVVKALGLPLSYVALPPITALDGRGSEGLGLRQTYTVNRVQAGRHTNLGSGTMFAVPSRVGPRTMPSYEALANQGIYQLGNGGRVFVGQRDETFYIDLGAVFDTLHLRRTPPILSPAEDANDSVNPFGNDTFSGFNVSTIAIELPIASLTNNPNAVIGMYASTSRQKVRVLRQDGRDNGNGRGHGNGRDKDGLDGKDTVNSGPLVQVARMANPLVNELIIGTPAKDLWNTTDPEDEARFLDFYLNSRLATAMNIVFGTSFPTTNRVDLVNALLKYPSQTQSGGCTRASGCSELLRLNLAVMPTAPAAQKRLSVLAGDPAGWPNGRRPNDDVTDIALRVVAGALLGPVPALGDGVNFNIGAVGSLVTGNGIYPVFPFLPTPHDGRNRRHIDCGEPLANPCN